MGEHLVQRVGDLERIQVKLALGVNAVLRPPRKALLELLQ